MSGIVVWDVRFMYYWTLTLLSFEKSFWLLALLVRCGYRHRIRLIVELLHDFIYKNVPKQ